MMRRALIAGLLAGCSQAGTPEAMLAPPEPGLEAKPRWLTFTCVEPGCETSRSTRIAVIGGRDVAIKRVVLSDRMRDDFTIAPSREPPFVLKASEAFEINASYRPTGDPRLADVEIVVTYTDASADDSEDRIEPGEILVPLVRRLIGEPDLAVSPPQLFFGSVLPAARKTMPLTITNSGFGNVGVIVESVESSTPDVRVGNLPTHAVLPSVMWNMDVTYSPIEERYTEGLITIRSADRTAAPTLVGVFGTSISRPTIALIPARGVEFGEVPVNMMASRTIEIVNQGAGTLEIYRTLIMGQGADNLSLEIPSFTMTPTVASLSSKMATLRVNGMTPGFIDARVVFRTNDRAHQDLELPVRGVVTQPNAAVNPLSVDFGIVPRGWIVNTRIELENTGYGALVVNGIAPTLGSSELFTVQNLPRFPKMLGHQERLSFNVEFRAEAQANFRATVAVDSNDPDSPFLEIPLAARGASCEEGCPIAHGTPSCASGQCAVGSCDPDWYDTDQSAATGCECQEIGRDPGSFCADGHWAGSLNDNDGDSATFTGKLATPDDIDILRFFAEDSFTWFGEDYDVRVRLETGDPSIQMCVYRHNTGNHENACFFENESCGRSFRRDGSSGPDDSADYVVKIFRTMSAAPTCTPYTVFMRNG